MTKNAAVVLIWVTGCLLDAFLIGGAAWLVAERGWNAWWILAAVILASMCYPYRFLSAINGGRLPEGGPYESADR